MVFPQLKNAQLSQGSWAFSSYTYFKCDKDLEIALEYLKYRLHHYTTLIPQNDQDEKIKANKISIELLDTDNLPESSEYYELSISYNGICIKTKNYRGAISAINTILQLCDPKVFRRYRALEKLELPFCSIKDYPDFDYRGMHLDPARHFIPLPDVLRLIDAFALFKINILHLHLTDDQGWRIEIKQLPKLTEIGGFRTQSQVGFWSKEQGNVYDNRPHGGFYTQEDIREIIAYAKIRGIKVIPEIDMPGHMQAAIAAYPELGIDHADVKFGFLPSDTNIKLQPWDTWGVSDEVLNAETETFDFLTTVFTEVCQLFESDIIMLGGDECPYTKWENSQRIKERMNELDLKSPAQLQNYFTKHVISVIEKFGKQAMCWDEVLDTSPPKHTIIACWRGEDIALNAIAKGYNAVNMPVNRSYFDMRQSAATNEPIPRGNPLTMLDILTFDLTFQNRLPSNTSKTKAAEQGSTQGNKAKVLGSEGALWSEHFDSIPRLEDAAFPRTVALAELLWNGYKTDDNAKDVAMKIERETSRILQNLSIRCRDSKTGVTDDLLRPDAVGDQG